MYRIILVFVLAITLNSCSKDTTEQETESLKLTDITSLTSYDATIKTGVTLVFFHATWCSICAAQRPDVEALTSETSIKGAKLGQVDTDKNKDITAKYKVIGQPVIVIYKDNVEKYRFSGKGHSNTKLAALVKGLL